VLGEWALSMVGVEERREFRFRGDLYSQESTFPLVKNILLRKLSMYVCLLTSVHCLCDVCH